MALLRPVSSRRSLGGSRTIQKAGRARSATQNNALGQQSTGRSGSNRRLNSDTRNTKTHPRMRSTERNGSSRRLRSDTRDTNQYPQAANNEKKLPEKERKGEGRLPAEEEFESEEGGSLLLYTRYKAIWVTRWMFMIALPLHTIQMFLSLLAVSGIALSSISFVGYIIDGETLGVASMSVGLVIPVLLMVTAFLLFVARQVNCTSGWKFPIFTLCFALSLLPLINTFPFVLVWCLSVVYFQYPEDYEND